MKTNLLTFVLGQIRRNDVSVPNVARATGLSTQWLYMLRRGKIPNPGVKQIQTLAEYFSA